jgi:galactose mutarotase-like enzyme
MDNWTIHSEGIEAVISAHGAELCSLKNSDGIELLWQAGAQWPRHAPILFPIVGRLKNDQLRHNGIVYPMKQHGLARDLAFEWVERDLTSCRLILKDSAETRIHYPFSFTLTVSYAVNGADFDVVVEIDNTGNEILPASIGAHPAFNWPLLPGLNKDSYSLTFFNDEIEPIRRLKDGLLQTDPEPTPVRGNFLALSETLFENDALILDRPASMSVRYAADSGPSILMRWQGYRELGLWSKPGASFLCIEPWHGFASPSDFDGEFIEKPGLMLIAPNAKRVVSYRVSVG